jgi:hypothetical protein
MVLRIPDVVGGWYDKLLHSVVPKNLRAVHFHKKNLEGRRDGKDLVCKLLRLKVLRGRQLRFHVPRACPVPLSQKNSHEILDPQIRHIQCLHSHRFRIRQNSSSPGAVELELSRP